ncbi:unnamed protein product [Calicophoron daubneyi]|uniref:Uncharacterized protein n=1 Tax=Calicophoron daubneyi TaxID=300641 RepID=A0AAV2T8U7_CALDB
MEPGTAIAWSKRTTFGIKKHTMQMNLESVLKDVYGNGLFNVLLTLITSVTSFSGGFEIQSIIYMNYAPTFSCTGLPEQLDPSSVKWITRDVYENIMNDYSTTNSSTPILNTTVEQCYGMGKNMSTDRLIRFRCSSFVFDQSVMKRTVVTESGLVCDQSVWVPRLESVYLFFNAIGYTVACLFSPLGRRQSFLCFTAFEVFCAVITPFSTSVWLLLFLRCCRGLSLASQYVGLNLVSELAPVRLRSAYGNVYWLLWAFGYMSCAGLAYLFRDWKSLKICGFVYLGVYLTYPWTVCESPRWLVLHGRTDEAVSVIKKMARWNGVTLSPEFEVQVRDCFEKERTLYLKKNTKNIQSSSVDHPSSLKTGNNLCNSKHLHPLHVSNEKLDSVLDLFTKPVLCKRSLVLILVQCSVAISYYGLIIDNSFASDNIFLNVFLMGLIELPTSFASWATSAHFGRRLSTFLLLILTGLSIILAKAAAIPSQSVRMGLAIGGKFFLTVAYCVTCLYVAELYPTTVRTIGSFLVAALSIMSTTVAPFINGLKHVSIYLPPAVYSSVSIIGGVTTHIFLPETKGCPLAQTVAETETFVRGKEKEWSKQMERRRAIYDDEENGDSIN